MNTKLYQYLLSAVLLGTCFFFVPSGLGAQGDSLLFGPSTREQLGLNPVQSRQLDRMLTNPIYLDHYWVRVADFTQIQRDGSLWINLPDREGAEQFIPRRIEYRGPGEFYYYGELIPCDERMAYIQLIASDGAIFGQLNFEEAIYDLQDLGRGQNVLFKIDPTIYTEHECATESGRIPPALHRPPLDRSFSRQRTSCAVRVLVLHTAAAAEICNPRNQAQLFIRQSNEIVFNSEAEVRFELAGVEELVGFEELPSIANTRNELRDNLNAQILRDSFRADLVVLLTDGNWTVGGTVFGIAYLNDWGREEFGYAVVEADAGGGRFTFAHELAHDFGCKHDEDDRGAPRFTVAAQGHDFRTGVWPFRQQRLTVMHRTGTTDTRIMHFSNPAVEFRNRETGLDGETENAQQLSDAACLIASYRESPFTIDIDGPHRANNQDTYTWCIETDHCAGFIDSIQWEYSYDALNFRPLLAGLCVTNRMPLVENLYFRVTVHCSDGQSATTFHTTLNRNGIPPCEESAPEGPSLQTEVPATRRLSTEARAPFQLFPNPAAAQVHLAFELAEPSEVEISLVDIGGRRRVWRRATYPAGHQSEVLNLSDWPSGYYIVEWRVGERRERQALVKR